ncbi:hypothetical protein [Fructilactobacillus sanfranciscensis]|uniref:hypothetical protein n=1 Tax=Fructilactobacillus sanfranciscensis TaxID=1625 RepID=UPI0031F86B24
MSRYIINVSRSKAGIGDIKPKTDASKILGKSLKFKTIYIKEFKHPKLNRNLLVKFRISNALKKLNLNSDDVVLVHYPLYTGAKFENALISYLNKQNVTTIALIHDLDSLRFDWSIFGSLKNEVSYLNEYDYVISHNIIMTNKLIENGLVTNVEELKLFDYLSPKNVNKNESRFKYNITFAGNLNKAKFLKNLEIPSPLHFDLYGNIDDPDEINVSLDYHGSVSPEVLSAKTGFGYGLVWDGDNVDEVSGLMGNYLKFNNPYKISSYISSGMPVIVWEKSALSSFVTTNNIGITIGSLDELKNVLENVSDEKFDEMVKNVLAISDKIRSGFYLTNSIERIINK